ncbi:hypothetical protein [Nonomuraea longicatena]
MRHELPGDVGRRPERELRDHLDIGIRRKRPHHLGRQSRACRQPLPDLHQRIGRKPVGPLRSAGTLFEKGERDMRPSHQVDVVDSEPPLTGEPYGGGLEAHQRGHLRVGEVRTIGEGLGEFRIRARDEPIDQFGR